MTGPKADERGAVAVVALLVMILLWLLGVHFLTVSTTEHTIASNEGSVATAFYLAESGLALAKRTLRDTADWDTQLTAAQPFNCPALVPASDGGCSYGITNDAADGGGPTDDTNDLVIVRSTATYLDTVKVVEAAITRVDLPTPEGGMVSVGVSSNVAFNGNSFTIDGNNWIPPSGGSPASQDNSACTSTTVPKFGIAVPNGTHQLNVKNDLNSQQQDNVTGATPDPPWEPASATPSIGVDTSMTQADLEALVDQLVPLATNTYAAGTHVTSTTVGTQTNPKIVVVDATSYTGSDPALTLNTVNGAGILIVKNGTLDIRGNTQWVGIIIVIGSNIAIEVSGGGNKAVYGSIMLAEDANIDAAVAEGGGTLDIRYSCDGLNVANEPDEGGGTLAGATIWWREVF
ncbi:MAG: hypothetical protein ACE5G5_10450 [Candidatus Methylomirabilales bacterium]